MNKKFRALLAAGGAAVAALSAFAALADSTVVVTPADVGVSWHTADTRAGGSSSLVVGPAPAPAGIGSLQMTTDSAIAGSGQAKAQFFTYGYIGTELSDIDEFSFSAYRASSSTNSAAQTISLNLEVDYLGNGASFTTLVFEPIYNLAQGPMLTDTWQDWDAYAGGTGVWWSTKNIPGVCAFNCFVPWSTIVASNPNAKVIGGLGFNIGSGWAGQFSGNADVLAVGVSGDTTTFDFEPFAVAGNAGQCKKGGWEDVKRADGSSFKNQGDCMQYVNTGK